MTTPVAPKAIQKLSRRNKAAFFISVVAFFFLFPGIYLSMLTISSEGSVNAKIPHVEKNIVGLPSVNGTESRHMNLNIFDTTRSILKTVQDLWSKDYRFVGTMIFLFSVVIPLMKGLLLAYAFFNKNSAKRKKIFSFIKAIGKWSMCDVFIVAVLLSYLSTGATKTNNAKNLIMMGYAVNVNVQTGMQAHLEIGFWCFLAYCLLSLLALQLYEPY